MFRMVYGALLKHSLEKKAIGGRRQWIEYLECPVEIPRPVMEAFQAGCRWSAVVHIAGFHHYGHGRIAYG